MKLEENICIYVCVCYILVYVWMCMYLYVKYVDWDVYYFE